MSDNPLRRLLFLAVYVPFAVAVLAYVVTMGAIGKVTMVKAAFLPWWLPLISAPFLLVLVFVGLGWLDLDVVETDEMKADSDVEELMYRVRELEAETGGDSRDGEWSSMATSGAGVLSVGTRNISPRATVHP